MPLPEPGEILIEGEAFVEVLGQVEGAILARDSDGPLSDNDAGDAFDDSPDDFVHRGRDVANLPVRFADRRRKETNRREIRSRRS